MNNEMVEARVRIIENSNQVNSGCWEYKLKTRPNGYARMSFLGKSWYAHRLSYLSFFGVLNKKLDVCHKCDNRKCVNPLHLFQGTRKENMQDAVSKNRQARGSMLPHTKIHGKDLIKAIELIKRGVKHRIIAEKFGVTRSCISFIARKNNIKR